MHQEQICTYIRLAFRQITNVLVLKCKWKKNCKGRLNELISFSPFSFSKNAVKVLYLAQI